MSETSQRPAGGSARSGAKKAIALLIVLGGLGAIGVLALALPSRSRDDAPTDPPPVNVEIETVRPDARMPDEFILHGVVAPNRTVLVAAEVSGQIETVGSRASDLNFGGKTYTKGQVLCEGEPIAKGDCIVVLNTDLLQAEHDRAKAQAEYDAREYARMLDLHERNVAGRQELDEAKTNMEMSKAALVLAAEKLKRTKIIAPISGILNDLPQEVGQFVGVGTCVAEIVDIDTVKVIVDVSEKDVHYLKVGDEAEVLIDPLGDARTTGEIAFISQLADEQARTTRVEISVPNEERLLRSGQIVRARLVRRILKDAIMIPLGAVIPLENGKVVYTVEDNRAHRRDVEVDLGFIRGVRIHVLRGLSGGEQLIVSGHRYVGDGQEVVIRNSRAPGQGAAPPPEQ